VSQGDPPVEREEGTAQALVRALRSTEAGFREFIDRWPDAVFVRRGGAIIHANDALLALLGFSREEVIGKDPVSCFVFPADRADVLAHRRKRPDDTDLRPSRWVRKDGEVVEVEVVGVTVLFEGLPARICLCRDTTERKRLQAGLLVAARMASLGSLAGGIAHEINNPLAAVIANLRVLAADPQRAAEDPDDLRAMVADALQGAERVRRIVETLRTFTRSDDARRERLELPRVIDAAVALSASALRDRARLVRDDREAIVVEANEARLVQVFVDLLVSAADDIPAGHPGDNEIRVQTGCDAAGRAVAVIHDTGAGLPPERLARVFDPFFPTRVARSGAGLGLSLSHAIVSGLGGELTAESAVGQGSTFRVVLPAAPPDDEP